jgi:hypothetical protein
MEPRCKPPPYYVRASVSNWWRVIDELVHLLERHHNDRFKSYMDRYLPHWQHTREILNREPLSLDTSDAKKGSQLSYP